MLRCVNEKWWISIVIVVVLCNVSSSNGKAVPSKRSASSDDNMDHAETTLNRININYDEYPMIVPKRAAILLDRIMVALHHALEDDDEEGVRRINEIYKDTKSGQHKNIQFSKDFQAKFVPNFSISGDINEDTPDDISAYLDVRDINNSKNMLADDLMGLQRRGHGDGLGFHKGRVYWRCYFNAVTCF